MQSTPTKDKHGYIALAGWIFDIVVGLAFAAFLTWAITTALASGLSK